MNERKVIGTHDGTFHCDEVLACAMLKLLPQYADASVKRTRNPTVLDTCDIVVDVGGVFDPSVHRYDHHQRAFQESFSTLKPGFPWVTRLSSAGLVYVHFGQEIIAQVLDMPVESELVQEIYKKVYEGFVEEIDAIDNGISTHDGEGRYKITTNLSSRVGNLNSKWNQPAEKEEDVTTKFNQGMEMVKEEFLDKINYFAKCWWPARELVVKSIEDRFAVDESGQIIEFSGGGCPWKEHFFQLEKKMGLNSDDKKILYSIFPDVNGSWRIQAVPISSHSFELRKALPDQWRGLRDKELDKMCGIEGCVFIHASGFIGGHSTRAGALEMGRKALTIN